MMMDGRSNELLERIGRSMLRAVPDDTWTQVTLIVTGAAQLTGTSLVIVSSDGTEERFAAVDDDGDDACDELRDAMHVDGKGTWYNARIVLTPDRQVQAEFDYDDPPFDGDVDRELLIDDQARYRRDNTNLPIWHPSRGAAKA
jgi:hypothetical protein